MGAGKAIGEAFIVARDFVARGLIRLGATPNTITIVGLFLTATTGATLALGAGDMLHGRGPWGEFLQRHNPAYIGLSQWNLLAGALLILCAATDMLDGAVARLGGKGSTFGAFLDSTLDRFSDFFIFAGMAMYYAWHGNVTYVLLAMLAINHAFVISYARARAEDLIPRCRVGYWQRGERQAAILISVFSFNVPALLWQQALSPAFTVWRRIRYTWQVTHGQSPAEDPRQGSWWDRVQPWRWPRTTLPYDLITLANILFLIFAPIPQTDLIRACIGR